MSAKSYKAEVSRGLYVVLYSTVFLFIVGTPAQAQSLLTHHVRHAVVSAQAQFLHWMSPAETLRLDVVLPLRDQAGLDEFLREVYNPSSPSYRHFLTVPEFTARFGPTQEDYDAVIGYLTSHGFKVVGGSRDGMEVQAEGSVTSIEAAFNVYMGVYQHPEENRTFYAPDREPTVDLPFPLWHISGLDNYSIPRPASVHRDPSAQPSATTGSGPSQSFLGSDMRAAYYGSGSLKGSGQYIGVLEFVGYDIDDLTNYYTYAGQTRTAGVVGISTDGTSLTCVYLPPTSYCDDHEPILDMTQALGMAPGITTLYVYVGSASPLHDTAILSAMTTTSPQHPVLPAQLSSSWLWCPADPTTDDPYFQKMAAQGQTFFQASGDVGAYGSTPCTMYQGSTYVFPADDAYVTTVGGTDLTTGSAGGPWSSETAWLYSGGGISPDGIPIPSWQQLSGVINSSNGGSTTYRNAPDVSANADFSFFVCYKQQTPCSANYWGGTSFAAPMWAGYLALANQDQVAKFGSSWLGFGRINNSIYHTGVGSGYGNAFHDVTSGNNHCCGQSVWYNAVTGYDLVTGWGSPKGAGLITALEARPIDSVSPTSLSFTSTGGSADTKTAILTNNGPGPLVIYSVQVTGNSAFSLSDTSCTTYLPEGNTCYAHVTFQSLYCLYNPTGQLTFSTSSTTGGQTVSLTGRTRGCIARPGTNESVGTK
jgi:kumamolisin